MASLQRLLTDAFAEFVDGIVATLPKLFAAFVFLVGAFVVITLVRIVLKRALERLYPSDEQLVAQFLVLVATVGMWFAAALALLSVLGLEGIAASMGTAAGFLALGVSYALSDMIADAVAGLYLLRDPDFNKGDTVTTASETGTVLSIGLRKSRLELEDGDVVVLANGAVESRWRRDVT
jgi:small-conductance mechanosensitive channel